MNIGYACLAIAVPASDMKSCVLRNADEARLTALIGHNLDALARLIDYNIQNGIKLFRISSDLVPFGSSLAADLPWPHLFAEKLAAIGKRIADTGMRVSMHPGQYTVLNSPDVSVAARAVQDLQYHARVLAALGLGPGHKLVLHLGGVYGNKKQAMDRFIMNFRELEPAVQNRLVLENDDGLFHIGDVLETAVAAGIPAVFDCLHHAVNPANATDAELDWIRRCASTWRKQDGAQKIHYSQQNGDKKPGAHSESIAIDAFLDFYRQLAELDVDIMLEVKDKNLSALKCINCVSGRGISGRDISILEAEWARYKYSVLEHSPEHYQAIRQLLRDKSPSADPALAMYQMIEAALALPVAAGSAVNAAQHVWGYFKDKASASEKKRFQDLMQKFVSGENSLQNVKNHLLKLGRNYQEDYLLKGYYFYIK
ncbi:MAG TPA: UV DNA damage repair endonuclease UvsE [Clostridiales bacterium]|nr:UV DNA damage repair endonuclease UvsE [Clostridiales bacterium]